MAIKTGEIFNSLVFGGVNSADYGIYITGEGVFNAPKRAVNMVAVPGRNGSIAIDQGHWENIEVTYPAGTFGMDEQEFRTALSNFRNAIASQVGYQRLTDTYHPDEYRMALYSEGLEVEPTTYNKAGEFELKFNCKPQRWLTSGEIPVTIGEWGATKTASGEIVTIESEGGEAAKSLEVSLEPIQAGSGTPSPSNVRPISGRAEVVTWDDPKYGGTIEWNQLFSTTGIAGTFNGVAITTTDTAVKFKGTATANIYRTVYNANSYNGHVYCVSLSGANSNNVWLYNDSKGVALFGNGHVVQRATADSQFYIRLASGGVYDETITAQIFDLTQIFGETKANEIYAMEQAQAGDGVAYFKSLFPKDYYEYNAGEETCVSAVNGEPYGKYTTALGRTVYGGTLDVVSGVLTVDRAMVDLGSLTWSAYGATASYDRYITAGIDSTAKEGTVGLSSHFQGSRTFAVGNIVIGSGGSKLSAFTAKGQYASASDFKTAMSGATFVYELATPQTYQLTPQQVTLLVGENHVWSDGSITMQYGDDPNSLWNPTRYDAGPLLAVKGHGDVSFNGYTVAIDAGEYGVINVKGKQTSTNPITYATDVSLYNDGDTIYVFVECDWVLTTLRNIYARSYSNQHDTGAGQTVMEPRSTSGNNRAVGTTIINSWFLSSQDETLTNTFSFDSLLSNETTVTVSVIVEVTWDTTNKTLSVSSSVPHASGWGGSHRTFPTITIEAASTKTYLGDPTLVDCELGEAYKVEDGEIISLNKYIELGSDLPKLSPGANDVTTDNTITELKVTPNWWKL